MISCHKPASSLLAVSQDSDTLHCGSEMHRGQLHMRYQLADLSKWPTPMRLTNSALEGPLD